MTDFEDVDTATIVDKIESIESSILEEICIYDEVPIKEFKGELPKPIASGELPQ